MPILAGQAALDIGNHQFLADLGHGGQPASASTNRQPVFSCASLAVAQCSPPAVRPAVGGCRSGRGCWGRAGADARGVVARRDRRDLRQAQSARQRCPSTNRARPPSAGETSRRIAASVLRGAPTPRRPLSPIPRNARCFTPSAGSPARSVFCCSVRLTTVAPAASATSIQYATRPRCRYS